jgi:hypothetical protein
MRPSKWIRVRPIQESDFTFIRRLASKRENFTIPPPYVLWLLKQTNARSCLVADHVKLGPVAYLLSLLVTTPHGKELYIWQMAASTSGQRIGAIDVLLLGLRTFVRRTGIRSLLFTAVPDSPEFRAIRRYAYILSAGVPRPRKELPSTISRNERVFTISVK